MHRVLSEQPHRSVLYIDGKSGRVVLFPSYAPRDVVWAPIATALIEEIAGMSDLVIISDSCVIPVIPAANGVVLGSPRVFRAEGANRMMKKYYLADPLFFPIPDEFEMSCMHKYAYPYLSQEGVDRRLAFWGSVPRYVFAQVSSNQQMGHVRKATQVTEAQLLALISQQYSYSATETDDTPHRLLLEFADGQHDASLSPDSIAYYFRGLVLPASDIFANFTIQTIQQHSNHNLAWIIHLARQHGPLATFRGFLFEHQVLAVLEAGGTFQARKLPSSVRECSDAPTMKTLVLSEGARTTFLRKERRKAPPKKRLLVPIEQNHPVCNAYVWDVEQQHHFMAITTVATRHDINAKKLLASMEALGWTLGRGWTERKAGSVERLALYWVVPSDVASDWRRAMPVGNSGECSVDKATCEKLASVLDQYVIEVSRETAVAAYQKQLGDPKREMLSIAGTLAES